MSMEAESRGLHGTTSTTFDSSIPEGILRSVCLTPAAAVSTLLITDASGNVNFTLQAGASGSSAQRLFVQGLGYAGPLTTTLVGAGAEYDLEVA